MKLLFAFVFVLSLQAIAVASDRALMHEANCNSAEAKRLKGTQGTCRVLLTPRKVNQYGSCSGLLEGKFLCNVSYDADESNSTVINVFCASGSETILDEDMTVESVEYNVTTIISGNGRTSLIDDPNTYTVFNNRVLEMSMTRIPSGKVQGRVLFNFDFNSVALTNVVCE